MHIILLANYLPDEQESMQRYADMLGNFLTAKGWSVEIIRPEPWFGRLKRSGQGLGKWLGYIDKFLVFPWILRRHLRQRRLALNLGGEGKLLVHICDHSNAMYTRWMTDVPHVVTCHDVLAIQSGLGLIPEHKTGWTGRVLQRWILSGLRRAVQVVCVSEQTRKELLALAPELEGRSRVVENPLNYPYSPIPPEKATIHLANLGLAERLGAGRGRFLLHVGGNQWYKNREGVIRIFGQLLARYPQLTERTPLYLVMVGKPPTEAMRRVVEQSNLVERVVFTGKVSKEQLSALYSSAGALIFPSLREGFGWPLIEAQACGCPVVTTDLAPMNQVAGPTALVARLESETAFADQVAVILSEQPELNQTRRKEALRYVERFKPEIALMQILHIYDIIASRQLSLLD